jgi:hypothetical protein
MQHKKIFMTALIAFFTTNSYAMFCPNGFNSINIGDSIQAVTAACGAPNSVSTEDSTADKPQEWTYYVKAQPSDQSTLRMTVAFTSGKVTNMSVNGIGLTNTQICGGNTVQVGDDEKSVKTVCGDPAFIAQSNLPSAAKDTTKVTTFVYNTSGNPITLTFDNNKLTSRK